MAGATAAAFTVSVAALLVAVPALLVTMTRNVDPLSEVAAATALTETYNALHILWQYVSPSRETAELYEMRYRALLRS